MIKSFKLSIKETHVQHFGKKVNPPVQLGEQSTVTTLQSGERKRRITYQIIKINAEIIIFHLVILRFIFYMHSNNLTTSPSSLTSNISLGNHLL